VNQGSPLVPFDFQARTRLVFGEGSVDSLGESAKELGAGRALVVSDPGLVRAGHAERGLEALRRAGIQARLFDGVMENPTDRCVERGLEAARAFQADLLVGLGGGSAMDGAKGVALLLSNGGRVSDYRGSGKVVRPLPPLIAVPTTAGTGSEVQSAALISDSDTHEKMVIWDLKLAPRVALLDPSLTLTLPPQVTAATGIDALSHALESYVSTRATALSRIFGREAFRLLAPALSSVLGEAPDLAARADMLLGAALAGLSIENSMLGAAHACANPLTARYGIAHGVAISLMLPHVLRYNGEDPVAEGRYMELLATLPPQPFQKKESVQPEDAASRCGLLLRARALEAKLPRQLRDCGVPEGRLPELAREASEQWTARFNPRRVGVEEFLRIYRCAY
jgi:alcohol dehydrogenase